MKDAAGNPSQGGQAKLLVHVELSRSDEGPRPADGNRPAGAVPPPVANSPGANSATPAGNPPPPQVKSVVMMSGECFLPFFPFTSVPVSLTSCIFRGWLSRQEQRSL